MVRLFTYFFLSLLALMAAPAVFAQAPSSISLKETGPGQKRDLSIPGSKMVINPFNFRLPPSATASSYSNSPALPLNVGYLHTQFTNRDVENLLGVYHVKGSSGPPEVTGWTANLADTAAWSVESQAQIAPVTGGMKLTVNPAASPVWQSMETKVQANIDPTTVLKVTTSAATGQWSLKLTAGNGAEVKVLRPDTSGTGSFTFNLQQLTGWSGMKEFAVQFFSIGQSSSVTVNDLHIAYRNIPLNTAWTGNMNSTAGWSSPDNGSGAAWSADGSGLTFSVTSGFHYFKTGAPLTVNLDESPTLKIVAPVAAGLWSVKINDGSGDITLRPDGEGSGDIYLNIPAATGWSGVKTFDIKVFAVSYGQPASVTISNMSVTNGYSINTSWRGNVTDAAQWIKADAQSDIQQTNMGMRFSVAGATATVSFRTASSITINVDKTPVLVLNVPDASGMWSMKVNDGSGDIALQPDNRNAGSFEYDLRTLTGWSGVKTFNVVFYSIPYNVHPAYVTVGDIRTVGASGEPSIVKASTYATAWTPHDLPFTAQYIDGASLSGYDYFYDGHTLVRNITFENVDAGNGKYVLGGSYAGNITYADGILQVTKELYSYALQTAAFNGHPIKYYTNVKDMQTGGAPLATPPPSGFWAVEIDANELADNLLTIATAFAANNDTTLLPGYLDTPLTGSNAVSGHTAREQYWDNFLTKVPRPSRFDIEAVDAKGVTAPQVEHSYYTAFVFLASSVLEPDPGVFNYPQLACKAALWDEGAPEAPFSASWDSFTGMQLYAYVDPALSWDAFKGVMSLTSAEGVIAGESLPSRKAQTAWQLFQLNKDTASLAAVYAPLSRYLNWRLKYPYWIYYTQPDTTQKDAEFVFSALVDLAYMREISRIVMNEDSATAWEQKRINFYEMAKPWFWATPAAKPAQYYNSVTHVRSQGNVSWVTTGFYTDLLSGDQLTGMNNLFNDNFNSNYNFYLAGVAKYPDLSYTIYGLVNRGNKTAAATMVDAAIRETVMSNMFSEVTSNTGPSYPEGVRPSPFSACSVIDFIWLKNGFDYDKGFPHVVNLFNGARGVSNINFGGRDLNFTANNGSYSFTGSYLNQPTSLTLDTALVAPVPLGAPEPETETGGHYGPGQPSSCIDWLKLYPNPSKDHLNVTFYLNRAGYVLLQIFDQFGRAAAGKYEKYSRGSHQVTLDIHRYISGVYYCNLSAMQEHRSEKFVKIP